VSDLDGRHERAIVTHGADDALDWSRDGRTIYYLRGGLFQTKAESIWAVPSGGGTPHRVVSDVDPWSRVLVSPDGENILFVCGGVCIAPTAGGVERPLTSGSFPGYGWLGDGRHVFGGLHHGHPVVASLSGERRRVPVRITTRTYDVSPDGRRVAWASVRDDRTLIFSADTGGGPARVMAHFTSKGPFTEVADLAWSPDSRRLVVVPYRHSGD
jgi:Tol biopolymer transport system component